MQVKPSTPTIRLGLVEDDVDFQHAFQEAVKSAADMALTFVASTRAQGLQQLKGEPVDVLLVDLGLPDGTGIDVIRDAHAYWPSCGIMVCTTFGDELHVMQSLEAGAAGYLLKDSTSKRMIGEIRNLHAGGSPISPLIARQILMRFVKPGRPEPSASRPAPFEPEKPSAALSAREQQVLEFITKGFTSEEIANLMAISRHTVQTFVRRIYGKLEVNSKTEAIFEARQRGLLGV
jgi:DNA-binding NarL/FixJ family response regulator